jgi:hypothetical protein
MKEIKSTWIILVLLNWDRREPNGRVCLLPRLASLRPTVLHNGPSSEKKSNPEDKIMAREPGRCLVRHIVLSMPTQDQRLIVELKG